MFKSIGEREKITNIREKRSNVKKDLIRKMKKSKWLLIKILFICCSKGDASCTEAWAVTMTERREIMVYDTFHMLKKLFHIGFPLCCKGKCLSTCLDHVKTLFDALHGPISNTSCIASCCHMVAKDFLKILDKIFFYMTRIIYYFHMSQLKISMQGTKNRRVLITDIKLKMSK